MPIQYFKKPCPNCGGKVRPAENGAYALCTGCGKKYRLPGKTPADRSGETAIPPSPKDSPSSQNRFRKTVHGVATSVSGKAAKGYTALRKKLNTLPVRIPLPALKSEKKPEVPPKPMTPGQKELYLARNRQLAGNRESSVPPPPPTRGEQIETFVKTHFLPTVLVSGLVCILLLVLLFFGLSRCIAESKINKEDFIFRIGDTKERQTYAFVTNKGSTLRINLSKLADLCSLTVTGTPGNPKYAVPDGSTYVIFEEGSNLALVNGNRYEMSCPAAYNTTASGKKELWVDLYFADDILSGITVQVDLSENIVTVSRNTTAEGTILHPVYETVVISAGNRSIYTSAGGFKVEDCTYKIDITPYLSDLDPTDASQLFLANKQNPMAKDYVPEDLVTLTEVPTKKAIQLRASAAKALEAMFLEMKADGVTDLWVTSGYRSYAYQSALFETYVNQYVAAGLSYEAAVEKVESDTARPGYSEHQTGLCVDFLTSAMGGSLSNNFENTDAFRWLQENAWRFGFILRYPSDKIHLTGYTYESWHYRFVGVSAAAAIKENGWCFEEYLMKN